MTHNSLVSSCLAIVTALQNFLKKEIADINLGMLPTMPSDITATAYGSSEFPSSL